MKDTIPSVSIAGAPTIDFKFDDDTCTAELAGAKLRAVMKDDNSCDMRIVDAEGMCLASVIVRRREPDDNLTEALIAAGSSWLWSHWRFVEANRVESVSTTSFRSTISDASTQDEVYATASALRSAFVTALAFADPGERLTDEVRQMIIDMMSAVEQEPLECAMSKALDAFDAEVAGVKS